MYEGEDAEKEMCELPCPRNNTGASLKPGSLLHGRGRLFVDQSRDLPQKTPPTCYQQKSASGKHLNGKELNNRTFSTRDAALGKSKVLPEPCFEKGPHQTLKTDD